MTDALLLAIRRLAANESLDGETITAAFSQIMRGECTPAQVAALLMALPVKGETSTEFAGASRAMPGAMNLLPAASPELLG